MKSKFSTTFALCVALAILIVGCASVSQYNFSQLYGDYQLKDRQVSELSSAQIDYWQQVAPILDSRCVVCHACYDAPCQLKLSSIEGVERGASKNKVYHAERLMAAPTSRLFVDAHSTQAWREQGFHSVLNEYQDESSANLRASLIHRMLKLKQNNPLSEQTLLDEDAIELDINANYSCSRVEDFHLYEETYPQRGMPYGLPALSPKEQQTINSWLQQGATYTERKPLNPAIAAEQAKWEAFFNGDSLKQQLVSRYIYEHLFLANLYFPGSLLSNTSSATQQTDPRVFFKLVRSRTPSGQPIDIIATRRPYDDPKTERVYYRLQQVKETISAKNHQPYPLDANKRQLWQQLFFATDYQVNKLPSYQSDIAANPFITFQAIPTESRYRFMLDEAQFTIMGFIKGPVCRGQTALNVIQDHFWVFFVNPNLLQDKAVDAFYANQHQLLELPSQKQDIYLPLTNWRHYAKQQREYMAAREDILKTHRLNINTVWDGDGYNNNAALTVFRHFDSASVEKGLHGQVPKTSWLIGYSQLERIHYLLVAGFDVYGNLGHQLLSRVFMDFLRMESESNLLALLPANSRAKTAAYWYQDAEDEVTDYFNLISPDSSRFDPDINYTTANHYQELLKRLMNNMPTTQAVSPLLHSELAAINHLPKPAVLQLAEMTILRVTDTSSANNQHQYYTILRHKQHKNMTAMLRENTTRQPEQDYTSIHSGIIGTYPKAMLAIDKTQLAEFIRQLTALESKADYFDLVSQFGIRRTTPAFWPYSDQLHKDYQARQPLTWGWLDYNRLENR